MVDITVRMKFGVNTPENVVAYALIVSDSGIIFRSGGKKKSRGI